MLLPTWPASCYFNPHARILLHQHDWLPSSTGYSLTHSLNSLTSWGVHVSTLSWSLLKFLVLFLFSCYRPCHSILYSISSSFLYIRLYIFSSISYLLFNYSFLQSFLFISSLLSHSLHPLCFSVPLVYFLIHTFIALQLFCPTAIPSGQSVFRVLEQLFIRLLVRPDIPPSSSFFSENCRALSDQHQATMPRELE